MRLVGYVRVSRVGGREGDSFISPEVQRQRIEQLAAAHGHTIIAWQTDLDQSGAKLERPAFQAALELVESGGADGIAVAKLDRFARSVAGAGRALERLEAVNGTLLVGDLGMDTSTPAGKLMRNVLMALAEFELDRIRENWGTATSMAIRRGVHAARVPFGYQRAQKGARLEPHPDHAGLVREVFLQRAAGTSWRDLARLLDKRAPKATPWSIGQVGDIIRRRTYLGEAFSGEHLNTTAHEPIVSRAEWEAAQSDQPRHPRSGHTALLAGLVRCGSCGGRMTPESDGRRGYRRYGCQNRMCPAKASVSEPRLDKHVTALVSASLERVKPARGRPNRAPTRQALRALERAEAELAEYRDMNLVSVIGRDAYLAGLEERARKVAQARDAVAALQASDPGRPLDDRLVKLWPTLTVQERRHVLRALVRHVEVSRAHSRGQGTPIGDRVRLVWRD